MSITMVSLMKSLPILIGPITTILPQRTWTNILCPGDPVPARLCLWILRSSARCLLPKRKAGEWRWWQKLRHIFIFCPKLPFFATTLPKTRCLGLRLCHQSNRPLGSSLLSKAPLPNHLHHRQVRSFLANPNSKMRSCEVVLANPNNPT